MENPNSKDENDENTLMSFSPGTKVTTDKYQKMMNKMASRNAKLKETQVNRRATTEKKVVDFAAMEQSFVEQFENGSDVEEGGQKESIQKPESLSRVSSTGSLKSINADKPAQYDGPFRIPSLPSLALPDVSAISLDQSQLHFDSNSNEHLNLNTFATSTPMVTSSTRRLRREEEQQFKAPLPQSKNEKKKEKVVKRTHSLDRTVNYLTMNTPSIPQSADFVLSIDEQRQRQFNALTGWVNTMLKGGFEQDEVNLGKTKEEAGKALSSLLQKSDEGSKKMERVQTYKDWVQKRKMDLYRQKTRTMFRSLEYSEAITRNIEYGHLTIRPGQKVYAVLSLQTTLLRLLFSFHPIWLHLALEAVFDTLIDIKPDDNFAAKIARFVHDNLFVNHKLLKMKKMSKNGKLSLVTSEGDRALHGHFIKHLTLILIFIEEAKRREIIPHSPRMFTKSSGYKSMSDVYTELSREVFSATGKQYPKVLQSIGFVATYKQTFFEMYNYQITSMTDLNDGVILAKLVEILTEMPYNSLMTKLRNPGGDRLRKIGNVQIVLDALTQSGIDIGAISSANIVGCNKEIVLELLWRMVGYYAINCGSTCIPISFVPIFGSRRVSMGRRDLNKSEIGIQTDGPSTVDGPDVMQLCVQIGMKIGCEVSSWNCLRDGRVLCELWRVYTGNVPSIDSFPGNDIFEKLYNAADTVLGVPRCVFDDDRSMSLFVHILMNRLGEMHEMQQAARVVQRTWRRWREQRKRADERTRIEEERQKEVQLREEMTLSPTPSSNNSQLLGATYVVLDDQSINGDNERVKETGEGEESGEHEATVVQDKNITIKGENSSQLCESVVDNNVDTDTVPLPSSISDISALNLSVPVVDNGEPLREMKMEPLDDGYEEQAKEDTVHTSETEDEFVSVVEDVDVKRIAQLTIEDNGEKNEASTPSPLMSVSALKTELLDLSAHENQLIDHLCMLMEEGGCPTCIHNQQVGVRIVDEESPVREVEEMFELLKVEERGEGYETDETQEEEEIEEEQRNETVEERVEEAEEKQRNERVEGEEMQRNERVEGEEADQASTVPLSDGNEESQFDFYKVDIDKMEEEEAEKVEEYLNSSGGDRHNCEDVEGLKEEMEEDDFLHGLPYEGLVLERSMIDGEISVGWTEVEEEGEEVKEEEEKCDLFEVPNIPTTEEVSDEKTEEEKNENVEEEHTPPPSNRLSFSDSLPSEDPFTGFEVMVDFSELKREKERKTDIVSSLPTPSHSVPSTINSEPVKMESDLSPLPNPRPAPSVPLDMGLDPLIEIHKKLQQLTKEQSQMERIIEKFGQKLPQLPRSKK